MKEIIRDHKRKPRLIKAAYSDQESLMELERFRKGEAISEDNTADCMALELGVVGSGDYLVFNAKALEVDVDPKPRSGDRAKRQRDHINLLLEKPEAFALVPIETTQGFIRRNFIKIQKFAITMRNKGKLHPGIGKILDLE